MGREHFTGGSQREGSFITKREREYCGLTSGGDEGGDEEEEGCKLAGESSPRRKLSCA